MTGRDLEDRIQAAYDAGVRDGRDEGIREGISTTLHRLEQIRGAIAHQAYLTTIEAGDHRPPVLRVV